MKKSALEQQSKQYGRIHELESVLRDTKRQLEIKAKTNAELIKIYLFLNVLR